MSVKQNDYAEGRIFEFEDETKIRPDFLETFAYKGPQQKISYQMNEFSAVCPFSGLPDYGIVWVNYTPDCTLVELKSLKYYFMSFRQVGIFQEAVTARIYNDLSFLLKPLEMEIKTRYNTRGGIDTTCSVHSTNN